MIIFTSICANYTHKARLLAESVKKQIPDARFIVCLTEQKIPNLVKSPYFDEIILSKDVWQENFEHFIFKHTIVEASTAVKGRFLQYLMENYEEEIFIYLDPDCYVYSDFKELRQILYKKPIVVCPHLLQPGNIDMELSSTAHGIYNLGFLAVRKCEESQKFVDWWTKRLGLFCYDDIPRGIFTDQKWVDLAPCFFDVEILKHRGYDFSIWSLLDCGLEERDGKYFVKGDPLRFIHFSGHGAMAEKCMREWLPDGDHAFKKLYQEYDKWHAISDADHVSDTVWTYATYQDGSLISDKVRTAYREHISWLPIENPFVLSDEIIAEKIGITNLNAEYPKDKEEIYDALELMSNFYDIWSSGKKVIFYGAGKYGKDFYEFCSKKGLKIAAFMISCLEGQKEYCGLPVVSIEDSCFGNEEVIIVPTVKSELHEEIRQSLLEKGYQNVFSVKNRKQYDLLHQFIIRS